MVTSIALRVWTLSLVAVAALAAGPAAAQAPAPPTPAPPAAPAPAAPGEDGRPPCDPGKGDICLSAERQEQLHEGHFQARGFVDLQFGDARILADRVRPSWGPEARAALALSAAVALQVFLAFRQLPRYPG